MSIEAITFVKALPVDDPVSRLLLLIIGENTFNDSCLCKVGQKVLIDEVRKSESTIRRHLKDLKKAGVVDICAQFGPDGTRSYDAIELLGFREWLTTIRRGPPPVNSTTGQIEGNRSPADTPHRSLVTGSYKDTVQESVQESAQAREGSKSGFEKVQPVVGVLTLTAKDCSWQTWLDHLQATGHGDLAASAIAVGRMSVTKRWPDADTPLPKVDKRASTAKPLADRVVGEGAA